MAEAEPACAEMLLLRRRMEALTGDEMRLPDWDAGFVAQVCWRAPGALTPRQAATVALLCWRHRKQLPAELVPASEPKLPERAGRAAHDTRCR